MSWKEEDTQIRRKVIRMKLEKAIDRAFDRCNLQGDECDIYSVLYRYKVIRELPDEKLEEIYEDIASRLGFMQQDSLRRSPVMMGV